MKTRRKGYILIVVLGLTAVIATLGYAFVDAHSTVLVESQNRVAVARSQYLAESGVAIGQHLLMYPPLSVASDEYWTGHNGIAIDASSDYIDVGIVQSASDEYIFTITSTGVAHDVGGTVRGKRTIVAEVLIPSDGKWHIPYGLLMHDGNTYIPNSVAVGGDLHVNGRLYMDGWCNGAVTASNSVGGATWGPPSSVTAYVDTYEMPPIDDDIYRSYNIRGTQYNAFTTFPYGDLLDWEANWLNSQNWATTNPGHVIVVNQDLVLRDNVHLEGTLVVCGDLTVGGSNILIEAKPDYPALVVEGKIRFRSHLSNKGSLTAVGAVLCRGEVEDDYWGSELDVTGTMILDNDIDTGSSGGDDLDFSWSSSRSVFWDFEESPYIRPITVLSWKEL